MTAERAFGHYLTQSDYKGPMIEWAVERLLAGSDCPTTALLAGADFDPDDEVLQIFRLAAQEEGVYLPERGGELPWLERHLCEELLAGRLHTQTGLSALYKLWVDSLFDPKFVRWCRLSESVILREDGHGGIEPFHEMTIDEVDVTILREARSILGNQNGQGAADNQPHTHS